MPALSVESQVLGVGARGRARADMRVRREFEVKIMRLGEKRIKARALENESIRPVVLELGPRQNPSRASRELRDPWESGCEAGPVCAPREEGSVGASLRAHQVPGGFEDLLKREDHWLEPRQQWTYLSHLETPKSGPHPPRTVLNSGTVKGPSGDSKVQPDSGTPG